MALVLFSQVGVNAVKQILCKSESLQCSLPGEHTSLGCCGSNVESHSLKPCTSSDRSCLGETIHITCIERSIHQDMVKLWLELIAPITLSTMPCKGPQRSHSMTSFLASCWSAGARDRNCLCLLLCWCHILQEEGVCSLGGVGKRSFPCWERGWHQGHLVSPLGQLGRMPFVSAARGCSHGAQTAWG